jgi:hypothetical protein
MHNYKRRAPSVSRPHQRRVRLQEAVTAAHASIFHHFIGAETPHPTSPRMQVPELHQSLELLPSPKDRHLHRR